MKIAVLSDTHDNTLAVDWIISYLTQNKIATALHAGDIINPGNIALFEQKFNGELHFVFGNNDGEQGRIISNIAGSSKSFCYYEAMEKDFFGKKIFMNHYSSISELVAQSELFDLAVGGHDHVYRTKQYGKTLFVNPGSTSVTDHVTGRRKKTEDSFVVIDLNTMQSERIIVSYE